MYLQLFSVVHVLNNKQVKLICYCNSPAFIRLFITHFKACIPIELSLLYRNITNERKAICVCLGIQDMTIIKKPGGQHIGLPRMV